MTSEPAAMPDPVAAWSTDQVTTRDGVVVPVRATARRPTWADLSADVRRAIAAAAGGVVVGAWSAGTGFTPGFASRLDLDDGRRIFVKAASSADDRRHGWDLTGAYREEARKLALLPSDVGAPPLLWVREATVDGEAWIFLGLHHVEGRPPRRPWQPDELDLVLARITSIAPALAGPPPGLVLGSIHDELVAGYEERLDRVRALDGPSGWLDLVRSLCAQAGDRLAGDSLVHLDLRDDNVLIGDDGQVWFVDWNFPALGAPWVDLVCILLSARGDGHDAERLLAEHPLSRDVDSAAIDVLLAVLWSYWGIAMTEPVPTHSPHLRDHQRWYGDVTRDWLTARRDG